MLNAIPTSAWLTELESHLAATGNTSSATCAYALLDCAFEPSCYAVMLQARPGLRWKTLFDLADEPNAELAAASPTLLALDADAAPLWKSVLCCTEGFPMLSVLFTPEPLDVLALRLHPWCVVDADGQYFVLRFPDTRRLPDIVSALTPQQHGQLFGPASRWLYRNRNFAWTDLPLPVLPQSPASLVQFDAGQFDRLVSASEADEVLASLARSNPALGSGLTPVLAYDIVTVALAQANRYGISALDRVEWCALQLQYPNLCELPGTSACLANLASGKASYAQVAMQLQALLAQPDQFFANAS